MPLPKVIIAAAGSGKTYDLVQRALSNPRRKVLIVTYTDQNLKEIRDRITTAYGCVPTFIDLMSWYSFLVRHCVRPYQQPLYDRKRIERPFFSSTTEQDQAIRNRRYVSKANIEQYYIFNENLIVGEFASDFSVACNTANDGAVIRRLENIYDAVFVDEVQDLAAFDLVLLELLFDSSLDIEVVGDCRQVTYKTNSVSNRYRNYRDENILNFFKLLEENNKCEIAYKNTSRRCNQLICNFADLIYPEMANTVSENGDVSGHDGVFILSPENVETYIREFDGTPQILTWNRSVSTCPGSRRNFGESKGCTFDRVVIYLTNPIKEFLRTGDVSGKAFRSKLYVAVTRAKSSVALVYDGDVHESFQNVQPWSLPTASLECRDFTDRKQPKGKEYDSSDFDSG